MRSKPATASKSTTCCFLSNHPLGTKIFQLRPRSTRFSSHKRRAAGQTAEFTDRRRRSSLQKEKDHGVYRQRQRGRDGSRVNWATERGTPTRVVQNSRMVETTDVVSKQMETTAQLPSRPTEQVAAGNRTQRQPLISCHIECCAL